MNTKPTKEEINHRKAECQKGLKLIDECFELNGLSPWLGLDICGNYCIIELAECEIPDEEIDTYFNMLAKEAKLYKKRIK